MNSCTMFYKGLDICDNYQRPVPSLVVSKHIGLHTRIHSKLVKILAQLDAEVARE